MLDLKYVMFKTPDGLELPVIFSSSFSHVDMASLINSKYPGIKHVSAGFVKFNEGKFSHCYGYSHSLKENNTSREIDSTILEIFTR